jgi:hypothetical protein
MSAPTRDTSITVPHRTAGDFAQDRQTRTWVLPPGIPEPHPVQIVEYSQREIANLSRLPRGWDGADGIPLHPALVNAALNVIIKLTFRPGLATPQFSPSADGGLDIIWLVGGNRLTASLGLEQISLYGTRVDHSDAFPRFECRWFELEIHELDVAMKEARIFLDEISEGVAHQLSVL